MTDAVPERGPLRVAILGAGPAGSALAILLARQGGDVTLFDDGRRPELLVGESLVPAVVPILRCLGIEEETATFSCVKPGVSFIWSPTDRVSVTFARFAPAVFPYAYNVPRPRFDEVLLARATASGVRHVPARAELHAVPAHERRAELALAPETLDAALDGRPPHLIVDATGRARRVARALAIPARLGPRKDVAHFAHFEGFRWDDAPGQVLIARGAAGWSWCIPLRERLSIGIVLGQDDAAHLGRTPDERLDRAIATDPWLSSIVGTGKRVTGVATYANYQLIAERGHGRGWAMVGDAFGFVDPMLSPGVFLALRSAELVADALGPFAKSARAPAAAEIEAALRPYAAAQTAMLAAWLDLIATFYDGRMAALVRAGRDWMSSGATIFKSAAQTHIERHIALQASGAGTLRPYSRGLLRFMGRYGRRGIDPTSLAIR
jgi:flavin-dependent dehydrogenase